jgi:hypothetical protein
MLCMILFSRFARRTRFIAIHALFTFVLFGPASIASAQHGATTITCGLDRLTAEAGAIVHGYVISAKVEPHPQLRNLMTVVVSMRVEDVYKGKPQKNLVFRQYIWDLADRGATAGYGKGQELVLFLVPTSQYGLTSPVGLEQGRFRISRNSKGQSVATNGNNNFGLLNSIEAQARSRNVRLSRRTIELAKQPSGPLPLTDLADAIRTFAGGR